MTTFLTGDKGQRYEVRAKDAQGREFVVGWTEDPEGLIECVNQHPQMNSPRVIDRKENGNENDGNQ